MGEKYILDRMIGKGGMGVVWAGTNERTGKRVALKVIRRSFGANSQAAESFRREALAASRVNHPNVVSVFDVIDHESTTCIVMELLDGEPLNDYLAREGPLSIEKAAALLLPAMRGVAAANAQGVVHRDLKPHNIFLCVGSDRRLVTTKVLDFGCSVMMEKSIGQSSAAGHVAIVGSPAYMAPEHISGAPHIDQRADVYGFGVVFFEALAGQHPFPGPPGPALLARILYEPPLPLGSIRADLPVKVIQIIECALAKDPNARFANLDPFIRLVEEHMLHNAPLPRSMTPLVGVPHYPPSKSSSGLADAVVQIPRRAEASGLLETRVMFSVAPESPANGGAASHSRSKGNPLEEHAPSSPAAEDELPTWRRSLKRFLGRPLVVNVMFGAIVLFVIWMAFPMPKNQGMPEGPAPRVKPSLNTARTPGAEPPDAAEPEPFPLHVPMDR